MAFVICFATFTVQIWIKHQSPLRWGPLEDAQRYHTEADAHRAIASLWLRGVTIQDVGDAGRIIPFPAADARPRRIRRDQVAARFFRAFTARSVEIGSIHVHADECVDSAVTTSNRRCVRDIADHRDPGDCVSAPPASRSTKRTLTR
jgi:hypothetical protein